MGPQEPPARRCVSLAAGTPRRAGPPYGLPAQADALRGQFWTPIEGQYSTPIDSYKARTSVRATDRMAMWSRDLAPPRHGPVYGWFTEGFDTPDLKQATPDSGRSDVPAVGFRQIPSQRQRDTCPGVDPGQTLQWSRELGSQPTKLRAVAGSTPTGPALAKETGSPLMTRRRSWLQSALHTRVDCVE